MVRTESLSAGRGITEGRDDAPEDNNDRRLGVRDQSEALINHKAGRENRRKVQSLKHDLYASTIGSAPSEFRTKGCVEGWHTWRKPSLRKVLISSENILF